MNIKLFETFTEDSRFPDNFNNNIIRGANVDMDRYVDDPSKRIIRIGNYQEKDAYDFLENFRNFGIQDPTKSIHMFISDNSDDVSKSYKKIFKVIAEKNSSFSYYKFNNGLGFCYISPIFYPNVDPLLYDINHRFGRLHANDKIKFLDIVSQYQRELIKDETVGNLSYDEVVEMCHGDIIKKLHIWTESPCLHEKIK